MQFIIKLIGGAPLKCTFVPEPALYYLYSGNTTLGVMHPIGWKT